VLWKYYPRSSEITGTAAGGTIAVSSPVQADQEAQGDYISSDGHFTFRYPKNLNITSYIIEGGGKKILAEEGSQAKQGFEITIMPFDEPGPLTLERIQKDLPDMAMDNISNILISPNINGVSFSSFDENIGSTYEVWFIASGSLYEITAYAGYETELNQIIKQWKFQ
jgi:hypothetical protein